jgi:PhnB protein
LSAATNPIRGEATVIRITPFLLFDGNCAEAMEFYHTCFGGSLTLTRLADTPMKAQFLPEQHQKITYALLQSEAVEFAATDWLHPVHKRQQGNTTAMYVLGDGLDELSLIFRKLREGADQEFLVELQQMPFGIYGRFTDRYGVEWFFRGAS